LYSDPWNRLTTINYPDTGQKTFQYSDAGPNPTVTSSALLSTGVLDTVVKTMDAYGHVTRTALTSDTPSPTYVATTYDGLGRVATVTNPYRSTSDLTYGLTKSTYDALNRPLSVTHPDSTVLSYAYTGRATQETDESGIITTSQSDALGRLTSLCEHSTTTQQGGSSQDTTPAPCGSVQDIATTGFLTTYTYDGLNNLTGVAQGSISRSFVYDSLSRLVCANNPEYGPPITQSVCSGQSANTTYAYDANGNLMSRTRLAPNQPSASSNLATTSYTYDALNRVLTTTYADSFNSGSPTPPSAYFYDVPVTNMSLPSQSYLVGRLSAAYTTNTSGQFVAGRAIGYDKMGRDAMMAECTVDDCVSLWYYELTYGYDLNGNDLYQTLTTTDNNSSFTLNYTYNAINQLSTMTSTLVDSNHPGTLLSSAVYSPLGGLASANLGNGATESLNYDTRGRLACDSVVMGSTTLYNLGLSNITGACSQSGFSSGTTGYGGNGDVLKYFDSVNGTWTNTYDDMNRLHSAVQAAGVGPLGTSGGTMGWTYDRFGNRWSQAETGVSTQQFSFTGGNNRINGYTYDPVGNLLYDGLHTYTYDDENRILTATLIGGGTETYSYDAEGRRIRKTNGTTPEEYVYDKDGNQLGEMESNGTFNRIELYAGNHHVVTYDNVNLSGPSARAIFIHGDWLGTERARSLYNGTPYQTCTNLPFGDQQNCPTFDGYGDPSPLHFTGKERDAESGLDYFGARYYGSNMGRFMSPDWAAKAEPVPYAKLENPQTLNLYAYVGNNPLSRADPTGHYVCSGSKDQCAAIQTGLNLAKAAQDKLGADSKGGKAIGKVLSFYGAAGEKNGVNVSFGTLKGGAEGQASMGANGQINIKFDLGAISKASVGSMPGTSITERAGTEIHEGTHGVDERAMGHNPENRHEELGTERNAYRTESYVYQGLGVGTPSGLWSPSWSAGTAEQNRNAAIEDGAQRSTAVACSQGCPP
jgi:RHS repeat-associated protein